MRPVLRHRLEGIRRREDAHGDGLVPRAAATVVSRAVEPLVMHSRERSQRLERARGREDALGVVRMQAHLLPLGRRQRPGLLPDRVRHGEPAEVVQVCGDLELGARAARRGEAPRPATTASEATPDEWPCSAGNLRSATSPKTAATSASSARSALVDGLAAPRRAGTCAGRRVRSRMLGRVRRDVCDEAPDRAPIPPAGGGPRRPASAPPRSSSTAASAARCATRAPIEISSSRSRCGAPSPFHHSATSKRARSTSGPIPRRRATERPTSQLALS